MEGPNLGKVRGRIRIRIRFKLIDRIRIRICIRLEGRIRIRVRIKVKTGSGTKVKSRIRIRINVMRNRNTARNWSCNCIFAVLSTGVFFFVKITILLYSTTFGRFYQFCVKEIVPHFQPRPIILLCGSTWPNSKGSNSLTLLWTFFPATPE